jgi:hypothetical protein
MKRAFILIQLLLLAVLCNAQIFSAKRSYRSSPGAGGIWKYRRWEAMAGVGTAHLYGDIGGYSKGSNALGFKDFSFKNVRFNIEGSMRYMINPDFSLRLSLNFTGLHASDSKGSNEARVLESSTFIIEPDLLAEYYIVKSKYDGVLLFSKGRKNFLPNLLNTFNIYGFAGLGAATFKVDHNTSANASGTYSNGGFAATIPAGFCLSMSWNSRTTFGVELAVRYALSDYIDGYHSQFSKSNDLWHTITFTYSYKLKTGLHGGPSFAKSGGKGLNQSR